MNKKLIILGILLLSVGLASGFLILSQKEGLVVPFVQVEKRPTPLEKYSFENLRQRVFPGSPIKLEKVISKEPTYTAYLFSYQSEGKKVTGQVNLPAEALAKEGKKLPVIVMIRGYADNEIYFTGLGTRKAAGYFTEHGFITLAPDFLGFGGSDEGSADILEARFERPLAVLSLLNSIQNLEQADPNKIMMWGHSNGGQVAFSVLEITQKPIPTTLWAPVSKGFPDSVLAYMGEMDDQGLKVKAAIDQFLIDYDPKKFSIDNYFGDITASLLIQQGMADYLVKAEWSDDLVNRLKSLGKEVTYYKYPRNDHNLSRDWDTVVQRDLEFFRKNLK